MKRTARSLKDDFKDAADEALFEFSRPELIISLFRQITWQWRYNSSLNKIHGLNFDGKGYYSFMNGISSRSYYVIVNYFDADNQSYPHLKQIGKGG